MSAYRSPGQSLTSYLIGDTPTGLVGTLGFRLRAADGTDTLARTTSGIIESPAGSGLYQSAVAAPTQAGTYLRIWDTGGSSPIYAQDDEDLVVDASAASNYPISYAEFGSPPLATTITSGAITPQLTGSGIALIRTRFPTARLDAGLTGVAPILATGTEVPRTRIAELITAAASANVGIEELP